MIPTRLEPNVSVFNILGFIGLLSMVTFWPLLLIFHATGIEKFEIPNATIVPRLVANIVIGTLMFDYCWAKTNILLGPLLSNVLSIISVPLGIIIDSLWKDVKFNLMYYLGTGLVFLGFVLIAYRNYCDKDLQKQKHEKDSDDSFEEEPLNGTHNDNTNTLDEI